MQRFLLCLLAALLLTSCAQKRVSYQPSTGGGVSLNDTRRVKQALQNHYTRWQGTPYRAGGMGEEGVDCSGFTMLTYHQLFGLQLGRSTDDQINQGAPISRNALRPGDLVFFRTGMFKSHVGIYLDNGLFLHASTTKGVTVSTLKLNYWQKNFWTARTFRSS